MIQTHQSTSIGVLGALIDDHFINHPRGKVFITGVVGSGKSYVTRMSESSVYNRIRPKSICHMDNHSTLRDDKLVFELTKDHFSKFDIFSGTSDNVFGLIGDFYRLSKITNLMVIVIKPSPDLFRKANAWKALKWAGTEWDATSKYLDGLSKLSDTDVYSLISDFNRNILDALVSVDSLGTYGQGNAFITYHNIVVADEIRKGYDERPSQN
jgi:hypothetical protein